MMGQGVDQSAFGVPRSGVDHQIGGLVDDGKLVILVEDGQLYWFRGGRRLWRRAMLPEDFIAPAEAISGFDVLTVNGDLPSVEVLFHL
jgi:hypothetical protein